MRSDLGDAGRAASSADKAGTGCDRRYATARRQEDNTSSSPLANPPPQKQLRLPDCTRKISSLLRWMCGGGPSPGGVRQSSTVSEEPVCSPEPTRPSSLRTGAVASHSPAASEQAGRRRGGVHRTRRTPHLPNPRRLHPAVSSSATANISGRCAALVIGSVPAATLGYRATPPPVIKNRSWRTGSRGVGKGRQRGLHGGDRAQYRDI